MGVKERFYVDIMSAHPEVTGSCNLVIVKLPNRETIKFVVDCGLFQEQEYEKLNETLPFDSEEVDFCLVTHNHVDHTGRIPYMVKQGFYNQIYTTETTTKLLPLAWYDSFKVLKDLAKRKHTKCLYGENHVAYAISKLNPCKYNKTIYVHKNVKVTFFKNGHLIGASMILVQISYPDYEDINILFTGDYNKKNMFFDVNPLPSWVLELPLTVVQESTYGNKDTDIIQRVFKKNVLTSIEQSGNVLVPVFSLGRSQEILYELKKMQESKELAEDIPIYLDGKLAIRYTELYIKDGLDIKKEMRDFLPKNLTFVTNEIRSEILENTEPKIILTTSGMGSYGPAQTYIPEYLTRENALIHFTGYAAEGTLGHRLKETKTGKCVDACGILVKKQAKVEFTTEYSAHAKANEMIEFLKQFKDLKLVLLNHGNEEVKQEFAERIIEEVTKKVGILGREYFYRVNRYGLIRALSTKFH